MQPEQPDLNDPMIWFDYAKSDLALARRGNFPEVRLGALCFLCQQAVEKALKAILLRYKVEFPPTHNLKKLFKLLPPPVSAPPDVMESIDLVEFVLKGRYPVEFLDIQPAEYEKAVQLAEKVLRWAEKALK
jgi:HEPN domain-containing protein